MLAQSKQQGFTLIELLISLSLGMVAILGLFSFIGFGIGVNANTITKSQLSQETETLLDFMASEIIRAGYSGSTIGTVQDPTANPSLFSNSISISQHASEDANSCITFSYDFNGNGTVDTTGVHEQFGFRLRSGNVQIRQQGGACTDDTNWSTISDDNTANIAELTFSSIAVLIDGVTRTQIDINIQSQSETSNRFSLELNRNFVVRNYD